MFDTSAARAFNWGGNGVRDQTIGG